MTASPFAKRLYGSSALSGSANLHTGSPNSARSSFVARRPDRTMPLFLSWRSDPLHVMHQRLFYEHEGVAAIASTVRSAYRLYRSRPAALLSASSSRTPAKSLSYVASYLSEKFGCHKGFRRRTPRDRDSCQWAEAISPGGSQRQPSAPVAMEAAPGHVALASAGLHAPPLCAQLRWPELCTAACAPDPCPREHHFPCWQCPAPASLLPAS